MKEHIDPVDIPGLPPLERHSYSDADGIFLPDVRYCYRRRSVRRRRLALLLSILVVLLAVLLLSAAF